MANRPRIDFIISNPGHHAAMMKPVIERLAGQEQCHLRLLSLCEFRGLDSPVSTFEEIPGLDFIRIVPFQFRSPSSGGQQTGASGQQTGASGQQTGRSLARRLGWELLLKWPLRRQFREKPDLVVLPNDAAFPYDLIVTMLKTAGVPFLLMQEGIRFPLPGSEEGDAYGLGGAAVIAAWGKGSVAYFRSRGVPAETIEATGSPRFDSLPNQTFDAEANALKKVLDLRENTLLFLSNPIDDQGFCTTREKLEIAGRFLEGTLPLFDDPDFRLVIKLHPRESVADFEAEVAGRLAKNGRADQQLQNRITVIGSGPLYPLFVLSKAAIVLASTVGLEALMMGVPLGVLEIPGTGFVYDYVERSAAMGLTWKRPMLNQVCELLAGIVCDKQAVEAYIQYSLSTIGKSTEAVTNEIVRLTVEKQYD